MRTNRIELSLEVVQNINTMMESKSVFLLKKVEPILSSLSKLSLFYEVKFNYEMLFTHIVEIVLYYNSLDVKCAYAELIAEVSK